MRPKKKVKMEDIANEMGVSIVTVSNALAGRKGVSGDLRKKILDKAEEMGYGTDEMKKEQEEPADRIAILMCRNSGCNKETMPNVRYLIKEAGKYNLTAGIYEIDGIPVTPAEMPFSENDVSGLIFFGKTSPDTMQSFMNICKVPAVGCCFFDTHVWIDYIVDSPYHNMMELVRFLVTLGHRKITFATKYPDDPETVDKLLGFWSSLVRLGILDFDDPAPIENTKKYTAESAVSLAAAGKITAIVCTDPRTQDEVIHELMQAGIKVPEQVSVAECGPEAPEFYEKEAFTAWLPDQAQIAERTMKCLSRRMRKKGEPEGAHLVPGVLCRGHTAAPLKAQK